MKKRVVVAMSGGVDSAAAAALLKRQGYEVSGITMRFDFAGPLASCGAQSIEDARKTADKLGIKHRVLNMQKVLEERVIKNFCREYIRGRTPNPCVRCNQYVKFGALLKEALSQGAHYLATGHYAQIIKADRARYLLKKARDLKKDQTYFLYRLTQYQLRHILFPLGGYTKPEVRNLAREFGLPVADKIASQEICFLPGSDYRSFINNYLKISPRSGPVVDKNGGVLGRHKGIACYTIGQREGLGIAKGYPLYVTRIDYKNNRITVGVKEDVLKKEFLVKEPRFIAGPMKKKVALRVKIRYNHEASLAEVMPFKNKIKVRFRKPQFAITAGQSAVFYDRDMVIGGGIIDEVLN